MKIQHHDHNIATTIIQQWPNVLNPTSMHYTIALSGGSDSIALLHIFAQIRDILHIKLSAIHINHGISQHALDWQQLCTEHCLVLDIQLSIKVLTITVIKNGLELTARTLRYAAFREYGADVIILAHHYDDQIETLFSQIVRGSDIHNIAAMRPVIKKHSQYFWRPVLYCYKEQLLSYNKMHQLSYMQDDSNTNIQFLRNFIRLEIIPKLKSHDKYITHKIQHTIESLQQACTLNDELAALDVCYCHNPQFSGSVAVHLIRTLFITLSNSRQLNILRYLIQQAQLPLPTGKQILAFQQQLQSTKSAKLQLSLGNNKYLFTTATEIITHFTDEY